MRIFKFRMWNIPTKIMLGMIDLESCTKIITDKDGLFLPVNDEKVKLMQFIGLKAKNGVEIFEGDIILVGDTPWLVEDIGDVEQDGSNYGLCASPRGSGKNYFIDESILAGEVIGNIYENPELLEKERKGS